MTEDSSSKTPQTNLEIFSPFILHASDNLGTSLVTYLLKEENYPTRRRAMINALQAKSKYGIVDGSITSPSCGAQEESTWIKCNSMVLSWIFNSLHPILHDSVAFFVTAQELWPDLEERFSQCNAPCVHQLKTKMMKYLTAMDDCLCLLYQIKRDLG
ncbi:hypothetical protein PVK06_007615 [Gossypium arboreum]|uniref:Retrotransposon Copia-like N-terminal domain-containing protein n=1 Tax=Gossypium arboreum TaxID=29729 RepID=A0ABR0QHT9_GOSAR|nr:hypothetical protein PVK06_007615 [Gossypium arboreum]